MKKRSRPVTGNDSASVTGKPSQVSSAPRVAVDPQADQATPTMADLHHSQPDGPLPQILLPGIDIEAALQNLRCDLQSFKQILGSFYRQRKNNCEEIAAALAHGDIDTARDILHGISGSSGYLGALKLYRETLAMSEACRSGDPAVAMERLPRFRVCFEEVMKGLEELPVEAPAKPTDDKR